MGSIPLAKHEVEGYHPSAQVHQIISADVRLGLFLTSVCNNQSRFFRLIRCRISETISAQQGVAAQPDRQVLRRGPAEKDMSCGPKLKMESVEPLAEGK